MRKGYTLIELIIAITLFALMFSSAMLAINTVGLQLKSEVDMTKLVTEMNYAFETLRLYMAPALRIPDESKLIAAFETDSRKDMYFYREKDVSKVTPEDPSDDTLYRCYKDKEGNIVILDTVSQKKVILVSSIFKPEVVFSRSQGFEPNFFIVSFSGVVNQQGREISLFKTGGIKLWYTEAAK